MYDEKGGGVLAKTCITDVRLRNEHTFKSLGSSAPREGEKDKERLCMGLDKGDYPPPPPRLRWAKLRTYSRASSVRIPGA